MTRRRLLQKKKQKTQQNNKHKTHKEHTNQKANASHLEPRCCRHRLAERGHEFQEVAAALTSTAAHDGEALLHLRARIHHTLGLGKGLEIEITDLLLQALVLRVEPVILVILYAELRRDPHQQQGRCRPPRPPHLAELLAAAVRTLQ